jgi:hypothetical protein
MVVRRAIPIASSVVALLILATLSGCGNRRRGKVAVHIESDKGRFPHQLHNTTRCVECHQLRSVLAGKPAVPGTNDHAPCDREQCHRTDFLGKPGKLCRVCHERVDPMVKGGTTLKAYPPVRGRRALASKFNHAKHLDYGAMERAVGFHVSCRDCHVADSKGKLAPAQHTVCARCHAPEAARPGTPALSKCDACHEPRRKKPTRLRRFITGDLHFRHGNHRIDRAGKLIICTECHSTSAAVETSGNHPRPKTGACVACHDDSKRTPRRNRMRVCETCHATKSRSFSSLAPRSHLPATERPRDHTLAFRRDHGDDARADSARCAKCHTFMSGSNRDSCDQCHQVMRPHSHTVLWREYEHGPAAATRTDNCSTCHTGGFCVSCHRTRPRSHNPRIEFRTGHGGLAVFNIRSCATCHVIDSSTPPPRGCIGANCHAVRR